MSSFKNHKKVGFQVVRMKKCSTHTRLIYELSKTREEVLIALRMLTELHTVFTVLTLPLILRTVFVLDAEQPAVAHVWLNEFFR